MKLSNIRTSVMAAIVLFIASSVAETSPITLVNANMTSNTTEPVVDVLLSMKSSTPEEHTSLLNQSENLVVAERFVSFSSVLPMTLEEFIDSYRHEVANLFLASLAETNVVAGTLTEETASDKTLYSMPSMVASVIR